jgi:prepilin-type processing-associated H-X9-DG protein
MRTFKPPVVERSEPVVLDYKTPAPPAAPADLFGVAGLVCTFLFFVAVVLSHGGRDPAKTVAEIAVFLLPLAAVWLGLASKWRPFAARPPTKRIATAAVWLGSVQLLVVLTLLMFGSGRSHGDGNRVKCASNLRQIGLAMQMYANDFRGQIPPNLETTLVTQDLTSEVFTCPSSDDERAHGPTTQAMLQEFRKPGHCSYVLASPRPATSNAATKDHVLAYEPLTNHNGDGTNVLFGDGHVEWVDKVQATHISAELKAGFNPPRKR